MLAARPKQIQYLGGSEICARIDSAMHNLEAMHTTERGSERTDKLWFRLYVKIIMDVQFMCALN